MKSSLAISRVRCLYETDVSGTISVIIVRDLICPEKSAMAEHTINLGNCIQFNDIPNP
jgi:hypothetical protein